MAYQAHCGMACLEYIHFLALEEQYHQKVTSEQKYWQ